MSDITMGSLLGALFEQIDTVRDAQGAEVDEAIRKAETIADLSDKAIRTYGLVIKTVKLQDSHATARGVARTLPGVLAVGRKEADGGE